MTTDEIRKKFLKFFEEHGHKILPSSSLIPKDDPSVLLTTAGMQQFKKWFSGEQKPEHSRVATVQKCVRTSDIDKVGDETHLTFFEMLGNFSFGSTSSPQVDDLPESSSTEAGYFKEDAIKWGYEFISKDLGIPDDRIHFSIFKGDNKVPRDDDSEKIIKSIGDFKITECGREDNFWGPTGVEGPCGPTVEIYVDDVEVWNLVFNEYYMEYTKELAQLQPVGVDTGAGLERLSQVINNTESVFEIDEFIKIVKEVNNADTKAKRIISDHLRTAVFLLADGVRPSNLDRGYVLRRLIRRAIRYGQLVGISEDQMCSTIAEKIIYIYGGVYPNLKSEKVKIISELDVEESKFRKVIESGLKKLEQLMAGEKIITGEEAFELFATYGFPFELTEEMAKEKGVKVDRAGFEAEFEKHKEVSRGGLEKKFAGGLADKEDPQVIKYHTAAHLALAAMKEVLGPEVHQKGSNITPERMRFDFSWGEKLTDEQKNKIEDWVNDKIAKKLEVSCEEMTLDEAKKAGAEGEFVAKYGEKVKVYTIGPSTDSTHSTSSGPPVSREICGGPHVKNTGELGHFRIKKEESSSAGVRRIKAVLE